MVHYKSLYLRDRAKTPLLRRSLSRGIRFWVYAFVLQTVLTPIAGNGQLPDRQTEESYQFHSLEATRAQQWAQYYESMAGSASDAKGYVLLSQQWRAYADTQRYWAAHFHALMSSAWSHQAPLIAGVAKLNEADGNLSWQQVKYQGHMGASSPPVVLQDGMAFGLNALPATVHRMLDAGNRLQHKPYILGGGHRVLEDYGYDCSSAVSYVLIKAGLLKQVLNSRSLAEYGEPGVGRFVTLWVKPGSHTFMTICGLRLDTTGGSASQGPRWRIVSRSCAGFAPRHPRGL